MKKRILQIIPHLEEGGAQRQLSYLISHCKRYDLEIAALIASPPERVAPFFQNVKVHYLSTSNDFYAPEILPALNSLFSSGAYAAIHCWLFEATVQGVIAARLNQIRCVVSPRTIINALKFTRIKSWEKRLIRKTIGVSDIVLFPSHTAAVDYLDAGWVESNRIRIVPNGVDCEHFQPAENGNALVSVGRLSPEKGLTDLQNVVSALRKQFPELRCIVAGGGNAIPDTQLEFAGFVQDTREIFARGAIYITTSWIEGLSNALLEAQAMGLPAVVRNRGFNSEVIEHGVNGFLANDTQEFVNACSMLLKDPPLCRRMGMKAREKMIAEFSIQSRILEIENIYDELTLGLEP